MDSQIVTIAIVLTVLVAAIAAPIVTFMWWREKRKRIKLEEDLSRARQAGEKAVEIGRQLLAQKNELAAKVEHMEKRFKPVLDLGAECAALTTQI